MAEVVRRALLNELMTFLGSGRQELVTAILEGERGSGKTTLLDATARTIEAVAVARAACDPIEVARPFSLWRRLLPSPKPKPRSRSRTPNKTSHRPRTGSG